MKTNLLSISAGVDSTYLFYMLIKEQVDFDMVHINHNTRGEQNINEENFCRELADKFNKKIYVFNFNYESGNFQQEARNFRYKSYNLLGEMYGYDTVFLAHHKDDNVENILMQDNRVGSRLILKENKIGNINIIRPLIDIYKCEIYDFMKKNNLKYFDDPSNFDTKYLRNKFRNNVLSGMSNQEKDKIILDEIKRTTYSYEFLNKIEVSELLKQDKKDIILFEFIKKMSKIEVNYNFINTVLKSVSNTGNKSFRISNDYNLYLSYGVLEVDLAVLQSEDIKEIKNDITKFNGFNFKSDSYVGYKVRSTNENDYIKLQHGKKKINRYFIDEKIPKHLRSIWPIIVNEKNEIVHIVNKKEFI